MIIGHTSMWVWFFWLVWGVTVVMMLTNTSVIFDKIPCLRREPTFEAEDREERYELVGTEER